VLAEAAAAALHALAALPPVLAEAAAATAVLAVVTLSPVLAEAAAAALLAPPALPAVLADATAAAVLAPAALPPVRTAGRHVRRRQRAASLEGAGMKTLIKTCDRVKTRNYSTS